MDGAKAPCLYPAADRQGGSLANLFARLVKPRRVGGRGGERGRVWARACLEPPSVQILVVVANTQARALRADVEKGFV